MNPYNLLKESIEIINERGKDYGAIENNFENIARIANAMLVDIELNAYDVAIILAAVKFARIKQSPFKRDNYVDGVNYLAFAGEIATGRK